MKTDRKGKQHLHVQLWVYFFVPCSIKNNKSASPGWYMSWGVLDKPDESFKSVQLYELIDPLGTPIILRPEGIPRFTLESQTQSHEDAIPQKQFYTHSILSGKDSIIWWSTSSRKDLGRGGVAPTPPPGSILNIPQYNKHQANHAAQ